MPRSPYFNSVFFLSPYFSGALGVPSEYEGFSITLRKLLAELIADGKTEERFIDNAFDIQESYLPFIELVKLSKDHPNGKLYLVSMPADSENLSRTNMTMQEVPVLIGFQKARVPPDNLGAIDNLVSLVEQIETVCRKFDPDSYSWTRTDAIKDDNGVPFGYQQLTRAGVFETYFVVYYKLVIP